MRIRLARCIALLLVLAGMPSAQTINKFFGMHYGVAGSTSSENAISPVVYQFTGKPVGTDWMYIETARGTYNWTTLDARVAYANSHGAPLFWSHKGTPLWATSDATSCTVLTGSINRCLAATSDLHTSAPCSGVLTGTTTTNCQWKEFVKSLVVRYGNQIEFYESWNEPSPFDSGMMSTADLVTNENDYVDTIRANDSSAKVCSPAFILDAAHPTYATYMNSFFANSPAPHAVNCYDFHINAPKPESQQALVTQFQGILSAHSLSGPIYATESGRWADCGSDLSDAAEQAYIARIELLYASWGVARHYWYALDSCGTLSNQPGTQSLKPQGDSYGTIETWMIGNTLNGCTQNPSGPSNVLVATYACAITKGSGQNTIVAWNSSGSTVSYTVPAGYTTYNDVNGASHSVSGSTVSLTTSPILLLQSSTGGGTSTNAKLLFKSGFESSSALGSQVVQASDSWQYFSGTDTSTGSAWPMSFWPDNSGSTGMHLIRYAIPGGMTAQDLMDNSIVSVTGHSGSSTKALQMYEYNHNFANGCCAQDTFQVGGMSGGATRAFYVRYWMKLNPEAQSQMNADLNNWFRSLWAMKTADDFRIEAYLYSRHTNTGMFHIQADCNTGSSWCGSSGGSNSQGQYWSYDNTSVAIPFNQWFLMEIYLNRGTPSSGANARFYWAVNGQTLFDVRGTSSCNGTSLGNPTCFFGKLSQDINFTALSLVYNTSSSVPLGQWIDDIEIWDSPPCTSLPCGSGSSSNTAPAIATTSPLSTATVSTAYSATLTASGSVPITWGITSGALPTGLTLSATTGVISGTPSSTGTSTFTVQATNTFGNSSKSFSLTVAATPPVISSFTASPSSLNAGASSTLAWSTSGSTVLSIDQGIGTVTGTTSTSVTPTSTTTYTLTATNAGGPVTKSVTVTVGIAPTVATPQAAALPGHIPTDSDLLVASDHCETTLSADITNSTLSLPVNSLSTCLTDQVLFIDSEQAKNCSGASNVFTICSSGRGFAATSATTHKKGALVWGRIGAVYHNQLAQEFIAGETWLSGQTHHGSYSGGTSIGGSSWPNHIATAAELFKASDWAVSTLAAALSSGATSATVADGTGYQADQIVLSDQELFEIGSVSTNTLSGLTRGLGSTTAAAHAMGASVFGVIAALEYNQLTTEMHALEADTYGTAGSTQSSICGTACPAVSGVSWPNRVFDSSEACVAVNGGAFTAFCQNRLKDEVIAFFGDLWNHP